ncbi:MAG: acyl--CoA ligase [Deltaproteobacteria bacterium]|nr:acyl--CoA ligase [Deltaproteobacteria bacterium]
MFSPPTLIHHFLERSAGLFPDKVAVVHGEDRTAYAQINSRANSIARYLIDRGVVRGERIVLLAENSIEYISGYYGSLKVGGIVVPVGTDLKPAGLKSILNEIEPRAIISTSKFEKLLEAADVDDRHVREFILEKPQLNWSSKSFNVIKLEELMQENNIDNPDIRITDADLASIIFTSGSTGRSKGVMLTHKNIVSNTASICQYLHLTENDIQMVILPFYYVMGKSLLNTHFAVGGTVVINNKFAFPAAVLNEMVSEKVTGFSGVPATYAFLLHRSPLAAYREKLSSLRYCNQAGGHMSRIIKEGLRKTLPGHTDIYIMYGATEAGARLSYLGPECFERKIDSIGKAIPGVTLRVLDEKGRQVPTGQVGELVASGDNIMQGYWKDPEMTARVLDKNGYHTGDLCFQDEDGFFYLVGRRDNLIKVGGHRINPREIEDALMGTGLIMEAVVLGMPDELLGHRLFAIVTPKNQGCESDTLLSLCSARLPRYQVPGEIKFVQSLPRSASGKIDPVRCLELAFQKHPD